MAIKRTVISAAIGAAAGVAGVALADKKNRDKLGKTVAKMRKESEKAVRDINNKFIKPVQKATKNTQKALVG